MLKPILEGGSDIVDYFWSPYGVTVPCVMRLVPIGFPLKCFLVETILEKGRVESRGSSFYALGCLASAIWMVPLILILPMVRFLARPWVCCAS